jgi:hypothetical protein
MRRKIRAVLIDVEANAISDVLIEPTLPVYYDLLKCKSIRNAQIRIDGNNLIVDEDGLLKKIEKFFTVRGRGFNNSGLIVGPIDDHGNETNATVTADDVRPLIRIFQVKTNQPNAEHGLGEYALREFRSKRCCDLAIPRYCVCRFSCSCDFHGITCIGTHD